MLIAGERMANQDRVRTLGVERAVGLIGNLKWDQLHAGIELEWLIGAKMSDRRLMRLIRFAQVNPSTRTLV